jgi:hypothetical protein
MTSDVGARFSKKPFGVEFRGQFPGHFVTSVEGLTMPVFTFEKIAPPMRRVIAPSSDTEKPRGVLPRLLDRFAETRAKRKISAENKATQSKPRKSSK